MEHNQVTKDQIEGVFRDLFYNQPSPKRNIILYTNASGLDLFDESFESEFGYTRIYIGRKPSRIIKKLKGKVYKSHNGRYYRRFKIAS